MTPVDTFQHSTAQPRQLGDSCCTDGQLYTITFRADEGGESGEEAEVGGDNDIPSGINPSSAGTHNMRRAHPICTKQQKEKQLGDPKQDSWIWTWRLQFGAGNLTELSRFEAEVRAGRVATLMLASQVHPASVQIHRMGAFVWNNVDAQFLFHFGFPVWFLRPWMEFDRQVIENVVVLQQPSPHVVVEHAVPAYRPLIMSQAGSDAKFAAILMDSINSFKCANPFENLHLPGKYDSSFNLSQNQILSPMTSPPSTSLHPSVPFPSSSSNPSVYASRSQKSQCSHPRKPTTQSPKVHRDPYADLPTKNTLVAPAISAWSDINKTIRLFMGHEDKSRQTAAFQMWVHFRTAWIEWVMSAGASPQSVDTWRKVLAYAYIQPLEEGQCVTPKIQVAEDAKKLVEETIHSYNSTMSFKPPPCKGDFDSRQIIRELSMVNFQLELLYMDCILDTTWPQPSPGLSTADLDMQTASHRRQ
ncbi:hypothetical protein GYMLUDRAFT_246560 [Collybiopsis luxurians FD-317 M1]|uniref:Uncharacterized protein n=1 Tax=Collybiopsis luxurians FD-317 M1 TaxID=944289 RepID=A0A0D0CQX0_9AGAR|nr:hypothetical protein GYMLUDRAFT_246560 [Collybiopsis luxurians FD-317 M1]